LNASLYGWVKPREPLNVQNIIVLDLVITPREGGYARGQDGFEQILRAALSILIEEGYRAITFRKIAAICGIKLGNITYYFPTKEELIRELLEAVVISYEQSFDDVIHAEGATAEQRLEGLVTLILGDITTKRTTRIFPELWALSNHDPFVLNLIQTLYARARVALNDIIAELNPALPPEERETLALFISASMEGQTVFAGYEKPWEPRMPWITKIACASFLHLVKTTKPGEMTTLS
jgi:AcrR family transcriptional regulator